jgi:transposase
LQNWKNQLNKTGVLEPKTRRETWRKIDPERLKDYLKQYPDAFLKEMAKEFNCSETAIFKALKRLKISRKKNHSF